MTIDVAFTLVILGLTIFALARELLSPDILLFGALMILVAGGVVEMSEALAGFSNPILLIIASLYVVAGGMRQTGVLEQAASRILGRGKSDRRILGRLSVTTATSSAFLSNTPVVAMAIPAITRWAQRNGLSASKLLIPLSYASILGGVCTLIGTSTNLVVDGLLQSHGLAGFGFFELAAVGAPLATIGILYLVFVSGKLLPDTKPLDERKEAAREYLAEMELTAPSPLIGKTIEEAGLRNLPGLFLTRIERDDSSVAPVDPQSRLTAGDRLIFAGLVETIVDLRRYRGLRPISTGFPPRIEGGSELDEVVVSPGSPLVGNSIKQADFRARYNAAVLAVHRHGDRIEKRVGDIVLRPGDTLMLDATPGFHRAFRDSTDFYLVSQLDRMDPPRHGHRLRAVLVLAAVVLSAALELIPLSLAAVGGALGMIVLNCISYGEARRAVDWSVLVVIGSALGIAVAMETSGAAALLAEGIVDVGEGLGPTGILAAVLVGTMILTELITNNAAAAMMFPLAIAAAASQGLDPRPFVIGVTIAASLSFSTPIGYQTNLMVYGPGGYRFTDFTKVGLPLQIALVAVSLMVIPMVWPF